MDEAACRRRRERGSILQLDIISPTDVLVGPAPDKLHLAALVETAARFRRDPPPLCGSCDRQFPPGEPPTLISILRPAFAADGERVPLVVSGICPTCAALPPRQLEVRVAERLRAISPMIRIESGNA